MKPIAITQGDAAGIGPEIIVKAFAQAPQLLRGCFVAGDLACMRRALHLLYPQDAATGPSLAVLQDLNELEQLPPGAIAVMQTTQAPTQPPRWAELSAEAGRMAADSVRWAARAALRGDIAALVTAPLHKQALHAAGLDFPGHTEMLQAEAAQHLGQSVDAMPVRMMLASDELRVILVTIHMALRQAIEAVTHDQVLQTLLIADRALTPLLKRRPKLAVAGLNPHAGEGGRFGDEEITHIGPAVVAAQQQGLNVSGPHAPDTVFMRTRQGAGGAAEFDAVVAMYHDQGLIPVKYLGLEHGVNVTLGLPLIRTSPDHGTAFDIAGTGRASAQSLLQAVRVARELAAG